jgi:hypothetical protein
MIPSIKAHLNRRRINDMLCFNSIQAMETNVTIETKVYKIYTVSPPKDGINVKTLS